MTHSHTTRQNAASTPTSYPVSSAEPIKSLQTIARLGEIAHSHQPLYDGQVIPAILSTFLVLVKQNYTRKQERKAQLLAHLVAQENS